MTVSYLWFSLFYLATVSALTGQKEQKQADKGTVSQQQTGDSYYTIKYYIQE